jgi:hypothetical protein
MRRGRDLAALLGLAVLTVVLTYPLVAHMSTRVPGDPGDPFYTMFALAWEARSAQHGFSGFADANIFYPHRGTLLYGDALPALGLLGAPGYFLSGGNPVLPYNYLYLLSFFVAGAGMYVLARHLTGSRNAAFLAAVVYAFFPYHFAHISHLEIQYMGWMPFCFLAIHKFFEKPSLRNAAGMSLFYVLQVASCAYYGQYLTLFAGLMILYYAVRGGTWRQGRLWLYLLFFGVLSAAILVPYLWPYVRLHARLLFVREAWEIKFFSAELQHYLAVPTFNRVWGWLTGHLGAQEWQLFPGLVPVALAVAWAFGRRRDAGPSDRAGGGRTSAGYRLWDVFNGLLLAYIVFLGVSGGFDTALAGLKLSGHDLSKPVVVILLSLILRVVLDRRTRQRWAGFFRVAGRAEAFYAGLTVLAWLLSFGPVVRCLGRDIVPGPYALLYDWVPGFKNVRVPSRFAVVAMIGLGVLAAWGAAGLSARLKTRRARTLAVGGFTALVLIEFASIPLPLTSIPVKDGIPPIYSAVRELPEGAAIVELPMPARDSEESQDAAAVYFSLYHRKPIVNGYSGYAPPGYRVVREAMDQFPSDETVELLGRLGVSHALVHTGGFRPDRGREIVDRLKAWSGRIAVVAERNGDILVRLPPASEAAAPAAFTDTGQMDRTAWRAASNKNPQLVRRAFDGDPSTFWTTGYPQQKGDFFELDLGEPLSLTGFRLVLNYAPLDYPRSFRVDASLDGTSWTPLYEKAGFFPMLDKRMIEDFGRYVVPVSFASADVRFLRISLTASHEARHWSISEIAIR